jgi:hypothetical protein
VALVGLGRIDEINGVLDEITAWPEEGLWQGYYFTHLARWLRLNGHFDAARTVIARGVQWCEAGSPETQLSADWRFEYAWALYVADRWDDGYSVAKSLAQEFPDNLESRGLVGVFAASRGDEDEALEISQWLGALDRPYLKGDNTWWQSLIAGELGDGENAVRFLRQAFAEGFRQPFTYQYVWLVFESLRDYPPFQELMRPKG